MYLVVSVKWKKQRVLNRLYSLCVWWYYAIMSQSLIKTPCSILNMLQWKKSNMVNFMACRNIIFLFRIGFYLSLLLFKKSVCWKVPQLRNNNIVLNCNLQYFFLYTLSLVTSCLLLKLWNMRNIFIVFKHNCVW
jgi:hypothetical protein